ncbi:hypothetical protein DMH04_25570 [Kibdelosporangium aridum]|uniref:Uncharacterized protein n=1 Tax=Kibdelosporangium aridum TaxID=2030 RepID=A0A428Z673_KIBAR|nr:hypothetical protein [Kibdelosporangium aridum]RSM82564.1 hypothetical protein DMH04_25570 [Kibdelosporangium aridum]
MTLSSGKVVDSYNPGEEIVERKHTQLAAIKLETAMGYLQSLPQKYPPGEIIADTPSNREKYPHLVGQPLRGDMILEVPVQTAPVPPAIVEKAAELNVTIRDVNGKEYDR